ncbi:hypothetical protein [Methyloterricola oryzae]|uniref:hypothetical protein n=1 Tax=Methyloterricola oryzae TaxID=1495050 RepID=UPI0011AF3C3F|nr:hypothetical protein [Methyloterricola oryzae]
MTKYRQIAFILALAAILAGCAGSHYYGGVSYSYPYGYRAYPYYSPYPYAWGPYPRYRPYYRPWPRPYFRPYGGWRYGGGWHRGWR